LGYTFLAKQPSVWSNDYFFLVAENTIKTNMHAFSKAD